MQETPQSKTKVRIYLDRFNIFGELAIFSDTRLTDYMVNAHEFVAVTNAIILSPDDKELFRAEFLNVHKDKIVMIVPEEMITPA